MRVIAIWLADFFIVLGLAVTTLSVWGILRMPSFYLQLHAASMAGIMGIFPLLLASIASFDGAIITRALLIGLLLFFITPLSVHVLALAAYHEGVAQNGIDQSDTDASGTPE